MDFLYFYQNIPLHINPIAFSIGSFSVRWYALSYVAGFLIVYLVLMWRVKKCEFKANEARSYKLEADLMDFLLVAFFSALVGGRIGYVLLYNFSYFISNPLAVISPFENGNFVGLYGMSYHGGLVGIVIGSLIFLKIKKINFWQLTDFVVPAVPLGYFFGRIGNFLNGELYGRVTNSPFGMYFASDPQNLRHPSQLYEAVLEGLVLFAILWNLRNKKMHPSSLSAIYLVGYGFFRIMGEYFREPDLQIGFIFGFFTMGQALSFIMIAIGFLLIFVKRKQVV